MKKILLHLALAFAVLYGIAEFAIIFSQRTVFNTTLPAYSAQGFLVPVADIVKSLLFIAVVVLFWFMLQNADEWAGHVRESAAVIVFTAILALGSLLGNAVAAAQTRVYGYMQGAEQIAKYSTLRYYLSMADPLIRFSMLLLLIYAAVSLGRKDGRQ